MINVVPPTMPRRPQIAATIPRARRAPTPADVEPPSSRDAGRGGGSDCRRCAGVPRVRAVSPPRIELGSTLAARALRPPARPPPFTRRGGRAVPPRVRPAPRVRPGAGVASPRCRDSHARSCARGVLAWRRRSGLSGKGRSCADGAVYHGGPREPIPASVPWSKGGGRSPTLAKMVQVTTAAYESDEPSANNMTEHPVGTTIMNITFTLLLGA